MNACDVTDYHCSLCLTVKAIVAFWMSLELPLLVFVVDRFQDLANIDMNGCYATCAVLVAERWAGLVFARLRQQEMYAVSECVTFSRVTSRRACVIRAG